MHIYLFIQVYTSKLLNNHEKETFLKNPERDIPLYLQ